MPILTIGDRSIEVNQHRLIREAVRMFVMSPAQQNYRVEAAKQKLAEWAKLPSTRANEGAAKKAAAIVLSQGITSL